MNYIEQTLSNLNQTLARLTQSLQLFQNRMQTMVMAGALAPLAGAPLQQIQQLQRLQYLATPISPNMYAPTLPVTRPISLGEKIDYWFTGRVPALPYVTATEASQIAAYSLATSKIAWLLKAPGFALTTAAFFAPTLPLALGFGVGGLALGALGNWAANRLLGLGDIMRMRQIMSVHMSAGAGLRLGGPSFTQAREMLRVLREMAAREPLFDFSELKDITAELARTNLLSGIRTVEDFKRRMKELISRTKDIAHALHTTYKDAIQFMAQLRSMGISPAMATRIALGARYMGQAMGINPQVALQGGMNTMQFLMQRGMTQEGAYALAFELPAGLVNVWRQYYGEEITPEMLQQLLSRVTAFAVDNPTVRFMLLGMMAARQQGYTARNWQELVRLGTQYAAKHAPTVAAQLRALSEFAKQSPAAFQQAPKMLYEWLAQRLMPKFGEAAPSIAIEQLFGVTNPQEIDKLLKIFSLPTGMINWEIYTQREAQKVDQALETIYKTLQQSWKQKLDTFLTALYDATIGKIQQWITQQLQKAEFKAKVVLEVTAGEERTFREYIENQGKRALEEFAVGYAAIMARPQPIGRRTAQLLGLNWNALPSELQGREVVPFGLVYAAEQGLLPSGWQQNTVFQNWFANWQSRYQPVGVEEITQAFAELGEKANQAATTLKEIGATKEDWNWIVKTVKSQFQKLPEEERTPDRLLRILENVAQMAVFRRLSPQAYAAAVGVLGVMPGMEGVMKIDFSKFGEFVSAFDAAVDKFGTAVSKVPTEMKLRIADEETKLILKNLGLSGLENTPNLNLPSLALMARNIYARTGATFQTDVLNLLYEQPDLTSMTLNTALTTLQDIVNKLEQAGKESEAEKLKEAIEKFKTDILGGKSLGDALLDLGASLADVRDALYLSGATSLAELVNNILKNVNTIVLASYTSEKVGVGGKEQVRDVLLDLERMFKEVTVPGFSIPEVVRQAIGEVAKTSTGNFQQALMDVLQRAGIDENTKRLLATWIETTTRYGGPVSLERAEEAYRAYRQLGLGLRGAAFFGFVNERLQPFFTLRELRQIFQGRFGEASGRIVEMLSKTGIEDLQKFVTEEVPKLLERYQLAQERWKELQNTEIGQQVREWARVRGVTPEELLAFGLPTPLEQIGNLTKYLQGLNENQLKTETLRKLATRWRGVEALYWLRYLATREFINTGALEQTFRNILPENLGIGNILPAEPVQPGLMYTYGMALAGAFRKSGLKPQTANLYALKLATAVGLAAPGYVDIMSLPAYVELLAKQGVPEEDIRKTLLGVLGAVRIGGRKLNLEALQNAKDLKEFMELYMKTLTTSMLTQGYRVDYRTLQSVLSDVKDILRHSKVQETFRGGFMTTVGGETIVIGRGDQQLISTLYELNKTLQELKTQLKTQQPQTLPAPQTLEGKVTWTIEVDEAGLTEVKDKLKSLGDAVKVYAVEYTDETGKKKYKVMLVVNADDNDTIDTVRKLLADLAADTSKDYSFTVKGVALFYDGTTQMDSDKFKTTLNTIATAAAALGSKTVTINVKLPNDIESIKTTLDDLKTALQSIDKDVRSQVTFSFNFSGNAFFNDDGTFNESAFETFYKKISSLQDVTKTVKFAVDVDLGDLVDAQGNIDETKIDTLKKLVDKFKELGTVNITIDNEDLNAFKDFLTLLKDNKDLLNSVQNQELTFTADISINNLADLQTFLAAIKEWPSQDGSVKFTGNVEINVPKTFITPAGTFDEAKFKTFVTLLGKTYSGSLTFNVDAQTLKNITQSKAALEALKKAGGKVNVELDLTDPNSVRDFIEALQALQGEDVDITTRFKVDTTGGLTLDEIKQLKEALQAAIDAAKQFNQQQGGTVIDTKPFEDLLSILTDVETKIATINGKKVELTLDVKLPEDKQLTVEDLLKKLSDIASLVSGKTAQVKDLVINLAGVKDLKLSADFWKEFAAKLGEKFKDKVFKAGRLVLKLSETEYLLALPSGVYRILTDENGNYTVQKQATQNGTTIWEEVTGDLYDEIVSAFKQAMGTGKKEIKLPLKVLGEVTIDKDNVVVTIDTESLKSYIEEEIAAGGPIKVPLPTTVTVGKDNVTLASLTDDQKAAIVNKIIQQLSTALQNVPAEKKAKLKPGAFYIDTTALGIKNLDEFKTKLQTLLAGQGIDMPVVLKTSDESGNYYVYDPKTKTWTTLSKNELKKKFNITLDPLKVSLDTSDAEGKMESFADKLKKWFTAIKGLLKFELKFKVPEEELKKAKQTLEEMVNASAQFMKTFWGSGRAHELISERIQSYLQNPPTNLLQLAHWASNLTSATLLVPAFENYTSRFRAIRGLAIAAERSSPLSEKQYKEYISQLPGAAKYIKKKWGKYYVSNSEEFFQFLMQTLQEDIQVIDELLQALKEKEEEQQSRQTGGLIHGFGGPTSDTVLIKASPGEFVVNAKATAQWLPFLQAINAGATQVNIQHLPLPVEIVGGTLNVPAIPQPIRAELPKGMSEKEAKLTHDLALVLMDLANVIRELRQDLQAPPFEQRYNVRRYT